MDLTYFLRCTAPAQKLAEIWLHKIYVGRKTFSSRNKKKRKKNSVKHEKQWRLAGSLLWHSSADSSNKQYITGAGPHEWSKADQCSVKLLLLTRCAVLSVNTASPSTRNTLALIWSSYPPPTALVSVVHSLMISSSVYPPYRWLHVASPVYTIQRRNAMASNYFWKTSQLIWAKMKTQRECFLYQPVRVGLLTYRCVHTMHIH